MNSRDGYISKIMYVKMKESGPIGECVPGTPPRSTNDLEKTSNNINVN